MIPIKENIELPILPIKVFNSTASLFTPINSHPHWHNAIEVLYVKEGMAKQQINDYIFQIAAGDIIIIWGNQIHSTYSVINSLCKIEILQFNLDDCYTNHFTKNICFTGAISPGHMMYDRIFEVYKGVTDEIKDKKYGYEFEAKHYLYRFVSLIIRNKEYLPLCNDTSISNKDIIVKAFDYIDNNYKSNLTVSSAANNCNLSVPHFLRIFKNAIGISFKQYVNLYRINKSVNLLLEGKSVTATAFESGFNDTNSYIRVFKKFKNITPYQFRKQYYK